MEEAQYCMDLLQDYDITYPIVFDWEPYDSSLNPRTDGLSDEMLTKCAVAFCQAVEDGGYESMVYSNLTYFYLHYDLDRPEDGISRTIRLGTRAMADCAGILYMVADQPLLQAGTVRRIVDAWQEHPNCITAAAHNGKRGNPCLRPARGFSRNCVHWRQTAAAHPSFGGTMKMRCCSSRQKNANCSTATKAGAGNLKGNA